MIDEKYDMTHTSKEIDVCLYRSNYLRIYFIVFVINIIMRVIINL